jgi:hypothetical protein
MISTAFAAVLMLTAQGAAAGPGEAAAVPVSAPLEPGQERVKVKCEMENRNGSRVAKRVCRRLDHMALEEQRAQEHAAELNRPGVIPVEDPFRPK